MTDYLIKSIVQLTLADHFKGKEEKVSQFMDYDLLPQFKKDIEETWIRYGYHHAKGIILCEFKLI